ncbi:MAG: hypothetical protein ABEJ82_00175 [Haloplanus sp.]
MRTRLRGDARPSGLDVSLLGVVVAVVASYGRSLSTPPGASPHVIRFFDVSPERSYPAVLPQDKALLLLTDPSTGGSTHTAAQSALSLDGVWALLVVVGLCLVAAGPVLAWVRR